MHFPPVSQSRRRSLTGGQHLGQIEGVDPAGTRKDRVCQLEEIEQLSKRRRSHCLTLQHDHRHVARRVRIKHGLIGRLLHLADAPPRKIVQPVVVLPVHPH